MWGWAVGLAWLAAVPAPGGAGAGWRTVSRGPVVVQTRDAAGGREVRVETDLNASVMDIQGAVLAVPEFPRFMPYVRESRLSPQNSDGSRYVYALLQLPLLGARDYVIQVFVDQRASSPTGVFRDHWRAAPKMLPARPRVRRITVNQGSWMVSGAGSARAHVVYQFLVDPCGVPGFLLDGAARDAAMATLSAVEKEAARRALVGADGVETTRSP